LLDSVSRLVRLQQSPVEIVVLAAMIEREILFRCCSVLLHRTAQADS
jgi:hypothetical protein